MYGPVIGVFVNCYESRYQSIPPNQNAEQMHTQLNPYTLWA